MHAPHPTARVVLAAVVVALVAMVAPAAATAQQSPPEPLGLTCEPTEGVRHCANDGDALRVPSFDGVPIDVDVTLPPTGDGPWPTLVMINGLGGDKSQLQGNVEPPSSGPLADLSGGQADTPPPLPPNTTRYDNLWYAANGYAVVNLATRGFGGSCGFGALGVGTQGGAKLQTGPCADGFVRIGDARYEARDVQHLLGLLVDQGISLPTANGATGFSYGGGISAILGKLRDRVMCDGADRGDLCDGAADGEFVPWTSPDGTPMAMGAVYGQWLWTDLLGSVLPNGRYVDLDTSTIDDVTDPIGVYLKSYIDALLLLSESRGYVQNTGTGEFEWDLERIVLELNAGEPYDAVIDEIGDAIIARHGALFLDGEPAPTLLQSGWTDDVFPPRESLKHYQRIREQFGEDAPVAVLLSDYGHARSSNRDASSTAFNDAAFAWFERYLKDDVDAGEPAPGSVTAWSLTCPAGPDGAAEGGPFVAPDWASLHPTSVTFGDPAPQTVVNPGGDPTVGLEFDPIPQTNPLFATFDPCKTVPAPSPPPGTVATYDLDITEPTLMMGLPTIRGELTATGLFPQLAGRLYEVDADGNHRLLTRGVYRVEDGQDGPFTFQLNGNAYELQPGTTLRLELAPSDAPQFRQPTTPFSVEVRDVTVELPTRPLASPGDVDEDGAPDPAPQPEPSPGLPATGGGLVAVGLLALGGAALLRRRVGGPAS